MKKLFLVCLFLTSITVLLITPIHAASIRFAAIGDYGDNSDGEKKVAKLVKAYRPEFVITLGDNNYYDGCWKTIDTNIGQYYADFIGNYKGKYGKGADVNRFYPSLGNHDWYAQEKCLHHGNLPYFEYFSLPGNQRYYDFEKGPVHFFALDSDTHEPDGRIMGTIQYRWLKKQLKKSKAPFNVVYFHHAPFSSSHHGNEASMQWDFKKLGVDVVIAGHDHFYERIYRDGMLYFVNGLSGSHHIYDEGDIVKGSQYRYNKKNGFMLITADEHQMHFEFINTSRHLKDSYTLKKQ